MISVPASFADWRIRVSGEAGRKWVRSLPSLVARLAEQWDLTLESAEAFHGSLSLVVLVRRGEQPLALRISWPEETTATEALALRTWRGRGVMALLDAEPDTGALLLERLDHTRSLHTVPLREAAEIAGGLVRTLAVEPPPGLRTLRQVAAGIAEGLPGRRRALGDRVPAGWVASACRRAGELASAGERVLIHADLHYGNVLAATRQPWLATDPRPLLGTPEYSVPELMWNRADELRTDADVRRLLDILVRAGDLDAEIAHGWVVARCVDYWLWGLERGLTIDPARCERILNAVGGPASPARVGC